MDAQPSPEEIKRLLAKPSQEDIMAIIKDDCLRSYRVDIEVDSTIEANEQAEKARRNEFIQNIGQFLQKVLPVGRVAPNLIPVLGEMMMFTVRGYRAGRGLEDVIQQAIDEMDEQAKQRANQPPPPDPKVQIEDKKLEFEGKKHQDEMQLKMAEHQAEQQRKAQDFELEKAHKIALIDIERQKHGLSVAAHNKQIVDEMSEPQSGAGPIEQMIVGIQALVMQQQADRKEHDKEHADQMLLIAQALQQTEGMLKILLVQNSAPREVSIVRGPDGRAVGAKSELSIH